MTFQVMLILLVWTSHLTAIALDVQCRETFMKEFCIILERNESLNKLFGLASFLASCLGSTAILIHISGPQISYG